MTELRKIMIGQEDDERTAELDNLSNYLVEMDHNHHQIHEGRTFIAWVFGENEKNDRMEISLQPPASGYGFHVFFELWSYAQGLFSMVEGVSGLSGGTVFTPRQVNRNSPTTTQNVLCRVGLTGSLLSYTGGTTFYQEAFGWKDEFPVQFRNSHEFIIKNGVTTIFSMLNLQNDAKSAWLKLRWYELPDLP